MAVCLRGGCENEAGSCGHCGAHCADNTCEIHKEKGKGASRSHVTTRKTVPSIAELVACTQDTKKRKLIESTLSLKRITDVLEAVQADKESMGIDDVLLRIREALVAPEVYCVFCFVLFVLFCIVCLTPIPGR
jgi:hypothetical protein